MQDYNDNQEDKRQGANKSVRRAENSGQKRPATSQPGKSAGQRPAGNRQRSGEPQAVKKRPQEEQKVRANGSVRRPSQDMGAEYTEDDERKPVKKSSKGNKKSSSAGAYKNSAKRPPKKVGGKKKRKPKRPLTPEEAKKKKRKKIILFIIEILILLILGIVLWVFTKTSKMVYVKITEEEVSIDPVIKEQKEDGTSKLLGYRNIALFGVDSRSGELEKSTRTDTIMIASINLDTKEVKLVSVYRDTWLNLSNDTYSKANAAYAKGGPKQAISMLNMNLDMDITDYVTIGFDGLIDVIDAVGGIEIDVQENEIVYLNSYQISMSGKPDGTLNANGEENYTAREGIDYTPVTHSGLQKLNGLQATAYARIRYVGDDFARAARQRTVLIEVAKKAMTLNPITLNNIADAIFPKISTSLEATEIVTLLSDITNYEIGPTVGFPFDDHRATGRVGKASVVIPVDLTQNVKQLHQFLFEDAEYEPTDTVKKCSQKIASDTGVSYNGE